MFNWFAPRCPLDTWEKTWTETRTNWLAAKLGIDRLLRAEVIRPTDQHFPEPHTGSQLRRRNDSVGKRCLS